VKRYLLIAALALIAAESVPASPAKASDTCDIGLLRSYGRSWAMSQFSPALVKIGQDSNYPASTNSCPYPVQNETWDLMSQAGVSGYWHVTDNYYCAKAPMRVYGVVYYKPNPQYFTYHWLCTCSESVYSCAWQ
jgi:hypothetical protein